MTKERKCSCQIMAHGSIARGQYKSNFRFQKHEFQGVNMSKRTVLFSLVVLLGMLGEECAYGFNLDVKFPTFATIPEKKSYFGYSVDLYADDSESWLLVGAPKSRTRGEIYRCKYEKDALTSNCTRISITKDDSVRDKDMFGATLKRGPDGKQLLACAPYYTEPLVKKIRGKNTTYYDILGVCYLMDDFQVTSRNLYKLIPCKSHRGNKHDGDDHGSCEIGMSAAFTKNGDFLMLGSVGSFYRQGSVMRAAMPITNDINKLMVHIAENTPKVPEGWNPAMYYGQTYDDNYLGYGIATGKSIDGAQLLFAGAPRRFGYNLLGMVVAYEDTMRTDLYNFTGLQIGEYYGSAIAAADLNNDGLDDLIVGAPYYSDPDKKIFESGRIYVYYQLKAFRDPADESFLNLSFSEPVIIYGKVNRANFGLTISAIGDINQDGYEDIAVGAPYTVNEPNSNKSDGSVFIFNGGPEGLIIPASQEIKGMRLDGSLTAFGYSLAGDKDVDGNGYPDVITGAYLSDQAVLIRSRPVIQISSTVVASPEVVNIETVSCAESKATTSCFEIRTCFSYSGKNVPDSIILEYTYDIDSGKTGDDKRAFVLDDSSRQITLLKKSRDSSETSCVKEYVFFKIDIRDKLSEINVKVSHSLIDQNKPIEPVLNELKPPHTSTQVEIDKDCGDDDICQADLEVESVLNTAEVYVGQSWPLVLRETVTNKGESAFLATLVVEFPEEVYFVGTRDKTSTPGITALCNHVDQYVTCEVGNPLKNNAKVNVDFKFQTVELKGDIPSLTFMSFVNSTNPTDNTSPMIAAPLKIGVKSDITIYNFSSPAAYYIKDTDQVEGNLTSIKHTYEVINKGPSHFSSATIKIQWPFKTKSGLTLLELEQIEDTRNDLSCGAIRTPDVEEEQENVTENANYHYCDGHAVCASVECTIKGPLDEVTIDLEFKFPLQSMLINDLDSYIRSDFQFTIDGYPYEISEGGGPTIYSEITTACLYDREPEAKEVQWWIIAIAVGAGLLFLLILIFILWRCGFFVRKKKPDSDEQSQREALNPTKDEEEEMEQYLK